MDYYNASQVVSIKITEYKEEKYLKYRKGIKGNLLIRSREPGFVNKWRKGSWYSIQEIESGQWMNTKLKVIDKKDY